MAPFDYGELLFMHKWLIFWSGEEEKNIPILQSPDEVLKSSKMSFSPSLTFSMDLQYFIQGHSQLLFSFILQDRSELWEQSNKCNGSNSRFVVIWCPD